MSQGTTEIATSGAADVLNRLIAPLKAAGFILAPIDANPRPANGLWVHAGTAAEVASRATPGLLLARSIDAAELDLLSAGAPDVVRDSATPEEVIARLTSLTRRLDATLDAAAKSIRAEGLIDSITDGVLVIDEAGLVSQINRAGRTMLGQPPKVEGMPLLQVAHPAQAAQAEQLMAAMRRKERMQSVDVEILLHDGRKATMEMSSAPLRAGGAFSVISFRDVTQARAITKENRKNREFLERLVDGSSDAIVASDMRGHVMVFNRAAEKLFGISTADARARLNVVDIYPQGGAREMMRLLREAPSGQIDSVRTFGLTQSKELVPIEVSAALVRMGGEEVASVGLLRDLRERVRVEAELERARATLMDTEKQSAITALAGATAHELNQPLTVILGYVELIRRKADEPMRRPIDAIGAQAERMAAIVRRIAKLTHVETVPYPGERHIADLSGSDTPMPEHK